MLGSHLQSLSFNWSGWNPGVCDSENLLLVILLYSQVWQMMALGYLGERICLLSNSWVTLALQPLICLSENWSLCSLAHTSPHSLHFGCVCAHLVVGSNAGGYIVVQCSRDINLHIPHPRLSTTPTPPGNPPLVSCSRLTGHLAYWSVLNFSLESLFEVFLEMYQFFLHCVEQIISPLFTLLLWGLSFHNPGFIRAITKKSTLKRKNATPLGDRSGCGRWCLE